MNLRLTVVFLSLASASSALCAQQNATKPVLSAAPAAGQTTSAPASTQNPVRADAVPSDYVIEPEDNIQVTVWKEPVLSGTFPVRPDGRISLALLGDLPAAGFTPMKLSDDIATRLTKFVNDPRVTVTVLGVHVDKVYLLGEVGHVGPIALTPGMSPLQAISEAGGLSPYANGKHIYILRVQGGQRNKIPFNYKKAVKDGNEQGVSLLPGDTIVVP